MNRKLQYPLIILFLLLIFVPSMCSLVLPDRQFSEKENRVLAKLPKPKVYDIFSGSFSRDYEQYLSDQFPARDGWIGLKTRIERMTGKAESNDIYFAKDHYLIEKHTGVFETEQAQTNIGLLAGFLQDAASRYGTDRVKAVLVPNAVEILKDKLPAYAVNNSEREYLESIQAGIPEEYLVDAARILNGHSQEEIYYRTDHHWKTLGARYVYKEWAAQIGKDILPDEAYEVCTLTEEFLGTVEAKVNTPVMKDSIEAWIPKNAKPYTVVFNHHSEKPLTDLYNPDSLKTHDKYGVFFGGNQGLTQIGSGSMDGFLQAAVGLEELKGKREQNTGDGRRLLIIKDSYANCFAPFAVQDFEEVDMIDLRYFNESLKAYMEEHEFTDILFLYNLAGFAEDVSLRKLYN